MIVMAAAPTLLQQGVNRGSLLLWRTGPRRRPKPAGARSAGGSCARPASSSRRAASGPPRSPRWPPGPASRRDRCTGTSRRRRTSSPRSSGPPPSTRSTRSARRPTPGVWPERPRSSRAGRWPAGGWRGRSSPSPSTRRSRPSAWSSGAPTPTSSARAWPATATPTSWPPRSWAPWPRRSSAPSPRTSTPTRRPSWPASSRSSPPPPRSPSVSLLEHPPADVFAVTNQPPPLAPLNLFTSDAVLQEGVGREGGGGAAGGLAELGATWGGEPLLEWAAQANEHPPRLRVVDRYGHRLDEVEFHPAWHRLMALSSEGGLNSLPWTGD